MIRRIVPVVLSFLSTRTTPTSKVLSTRFMSDEVSKAIAAAQSGKIVTDATVTLFDKLVRGDIPSDKVFEDEEVLAFRDITPQAPTHILVIPKHRNGLDQIRNAVGEHTMILGKLLLVASQIGKELCPEGFRIVINDGKDGAQTVFHLHLHVIGGRQMQWPPG